MSFKIYPHVNRQKKRSPFQNPAFRFALMNANSARLLHD